ncbi:MAG: HutD family protein [Synergistaceae bacterium]|jgi:environmental stress-induced protein Ves|nr:HutD family protein [Synergistaceae bacterium]
MRYDVKKRLSLRIAAWSGGSTVELFIFPGDTDLAKRNFELRVSSATVEVEESVFSSFAGYIRHITPLTGEIRLIHEGHGEVLLAPSRIDTFEGKWTTRSYGRCVDFNLIHRPNWKGEIFFADSPLLFSCAADGFTCVYAQDENTRVELKSETGESFEVRLDCGDLLVVETGPKELPRFRVLECAIPPVVAAVSRLEGR